MQAEKIKILLVDDREENLLVLTEALNPLGVNLVAARSGREALDCVLRDEEYAVILLDIQMPGMDGFETAELLLRREKSRQIPILFLTAFRTGETDIMKGYHLGGADYIIKPFTPEIVRSKVAVFVELFRMRKEIQMHMEETSLLNRELEKVNGELSRSNRELEEFAYVVSHDLQEPLRAVANYLDLLERRSAGLLDETMLRFVRQAVDGAARMKALIGDLLNYARVSKAGADLKQVDAAAILRKVQAGLKPAIEESGGRVTHDPLPVVRVDDIQVAQLFQNLVGNALKFRGAARPCLGRAPWAGVAFLGCRQRHWCCAGTGRAHLRPLSAIAHPQRISGNGAGARDLQEDCGAAQRADLGKIIPRKGRHVLLHTAAGIG